MIEIYIRQVMGLKSKDVKNDILQSAELTLLQIHIYDSYYHA